jgi:hypothetical protein
MMLAFQKSMGESIVSISERAARHGSIASRGRTERDDDICADWRTVSVEPACAEGVQFRAQECSSGEAEADTRISHKPNPREPDQTALRGMTPGSAARLGVLRFLHRFAQFQDLFVTALKRALIRSGVSFHRWIPL